MKSIKENKIIKASDLKKLGINAKKGLKDVKCRHL